jgi:hypothetical protein
MPVRRPPEIVELSDFDESINALVYGRFGVGKTVLAGSAGLIVSAEKGAKSAKRQGSKASIWRVGNWEEFEHAYNWLRDNPDHGYSWVAVDSLTRLDRYAELHWMGGVVKGNPDRDIDLRDRRDYQKVQNMMKRYVEYLCELPCNVLFTAQVMRTEDEEGNTRLLPLIQGQQGGTAEYLCGLMDCVGYMEVKSLLGRQTGKKVKVRRIHWDADEEHYTKDQYHALGPHTDNTTLPKIEALINGSEPNKEQPVRATTRRRATRKAS